MTLQEILSEITEKYPHGLSNDSVIRKINQVQNELFRTVSQVRTAAIYHLKAGIFAYTLPFPRSSLCDVVVEGVELRYQDSKKRADYESFYYFIGTNGLGIHPTPDKDVTNGLSLFYFKRPVQLSESDLSAVPEFDQDFHMILVYGALVQIAESFQDTAMINNFTSKYNGLTQEYQRVNDETPDYPVIEDVMGGWF